jgi:ribosomal protein S27E
MEEKCPGQDKRNLKIELICCPKCGYQAEIFSDEMRIKCPKCKSPVSRPNLPSCLDWCKSARLCQGYNDNRKEDAK